MKRIARTLTQGLKAVLNGLEHAHEGELLGRGAKAAALTRPAGTGGSPLAMPSPAAIAPVRRVLLATLKTVRPDAVRFALEFCERMHADLVVAAPVQSREVRAAIRRGMKTVGLPAPKMTFVECGSDLICCVHRYVAAHAEVLFVVASADDALIADDASRSFARQVRRPSVPWVVVAGGRGDAAGGKSRSDAA
jgi:hypothetical protein